MYSKLNGKIEVKNGEGIVLRGGKVFSGGGWARGLSACWWGDGLPRL